MRSDSYRQFLSRTGLTESGLLDLLTRMGVPMWVIAGLPTGLTVSLLGTTLEEIEREQKRQEGFGPVTLWYGSRPLDQPGHGNSFFEDFCDTRPALQRVGELRKRADFHHPRITDAELNTIWNEDDLLASACN